MKKKKKNEGEMKLVEAQYETLKVIMTSLS